MKQFILLLIVTLLISCGNSNGISKEYEDKYNIFDIESSRDAKRAIEFSNNNYRESGVLVDGVKQGPWIIYDKSGTYPKTIANYADGQLNGPYNEYMAGRLVMRTFYNNGELEGEYRAFEKGVLIKFQTFVNGKVEGVAESYYPDTGQRMSALNYKEGLQHGISTYYNENGLAIQEYVYENGEQISSKEIDPNAE